MKSIFNFNVIYICPLIEQRVLKTILTLSKMGCKVYIIYGQSSTIFMQNLPQKVETYKFEYLLNPQFTLDPLLYFSLINIIKKLKHNKIDFILFRDIFLFGALIDIVKKEFKNSKIILDIADNFEFVVKDFYPRFSIQRTILQQIIKMAYNKLKIADYVLVVCKENALRIAREYSFPYSRIYTLENLPYLDSYIFSNEPKIPNSIVYSGKIDNKIRNIEEIIYSLIDIPWTLHIFATSYRSTDIKKLIKLVNRLELKEKVFFNKPVQFDKSLWILEKYTLGLIPHKNIDTTLYTLPHKLYDYIVAGKPVLASNIPILKNFIEKFEIGFIYSNLHDIHEILLSPNFFLEYNKKRENCINLKEKFNWEINAKNVFTKIFLFTK